MNALIRLELDIMAAHGCSVPECRHENHDGTIFFHGRCHLSAPVEVSYAKSTGTIRLACGQCHRLMAEISVAPN